MKTKFTSGEWVAEELVTCCIIYSEDRVIGESFRADDAHLMAQSKNMYRMLKFLYEELNYTEETLDWSETKEILAKARGE